MRLPKFVVYLTLIVMSLCTAACKPEVELHFGGNQPRPEPVPSPQANLEPENQNDEIEGLKIQIAAQQKEIEQLRGQPKPQTNSARWRPAASHAYPSPARGPITVCESEPEPRQPVHPETRSSLTIVVQPRSILSPINASLLAAAAGGHRDAVKRLLDMGADPNAGDESGRTALHRAAAGGHNDTASYLIKRGAKLDIKDDQGSTALYEAEKHGHYETVKVIRRARNF